jgi:hypothetical protein
MIYHYTIQAWLAYILEDGVILPSCDRLTPPRERAVWFSMNPDWEETASKGSRFTNEWLSRAETERQYGGLARIGVHRDVAPHDWRAYKRLSGIRGRAASALYNIAIARGARPGQWRVSFDPVPREKWQTIGGGKRDCAKKLGEGGRRT